MDWATAFLASRKGSRSTALVAGQWVLLTILLALLAALSLAAPSWVLILLGTGAASWIVLLGVAFVYLMVTNPSALQTERHLETMRQIDRDIALGDSTVGVVGPEAATSEMKEVKALEAPPPEVEGNRA